MSLPRVDMDKVMKSSPTFIYEGCTGPGKMPWLYSLIDWFKRIIK